MMKAKFSWCAGVVLAAGLAAPAMAQDADTVIAKVGDAEITLGHMIAAVSTLPQQYQQLPDETLFEGILDQLIQQNVLAQSVSQPTKGTLLAIENQTSGLLAGEAIGLVAEAAVTDDAIAAAYEAAYGNAEPEQEFNASHILVETEEEAIAIKADLDGGADFAETAQAKSTGPSGPNGGNLGWFGKGMMVPEFETAVLGLEDGQVSDPVQTQFGWHVVKLNESRLKDGPDLAEVEGALREQIERDAIQAHIEGLMADAAVDRPEVAIDPSLLRNQALVAE